MPRSEITAQAALGDVKVQSASGDIAIHEAKANVEGQSASGDQSIASLGAGSAARIYCPESQGR